MNYWKECIAEACSELDITMSQKQKDMLADFIEDAAESMSTVMGYDNIHVETEAERKLSALEKYVSDREKWENETEPCLRCNTLGLVRDLWGHEFPCPTCGGRRRVK